MAEAGKILFIVVLDDVDEKDNDRESFRYARPVLQSTLQLMGCKARHAFKISQRVFEIIRSESCALSMMPDGMIASDLRPPKENFEKAEADGMNQFFPGKDEKIKSVPFEMYKKRTTAFVRREKFLDIVCDALSEYKYVGPNQRADLVLACRIRERKESVTVLLCGTSGCGKSTLSALLGYRLGITTVLSTDSIRHMMRSFADEKENPLLWASTYHAGECLDPVAVAEAKVRRKAKKLAVVSRSVQKDEITVDQCSGNSDAQKSEVRSGTTELLSRKQMAVEGYKAQSEMVIDSLDRLITAWEERKESVVVEGVHLSLNFIMGLMKKHPSIIPFMIYIANEDKHLERFAVRAKYMTLDPAKNKYVKYIRNIRTIQDYLCKRADKYFVPKINNTNVDKSVAAIHATVFSCLRRREAGEQLYDPIRCTVTVVDEEYRNQCAANSLSSKGMFQLIQRKGSSRHLMALVNTDGSVAKAWPVNSVDNNGKPARGPGSRNGIGNPMYGPLQISKAEPVNLQFGLYGISAWPSDGGTSRAGSVDGTETGSRYLSSGCSSPRFSDVPAKELKEEHSVHGSDEEIDDPPEIGSDDDLSDGRDQRDDDEVGSVDEESNMSDEDYDDLAMQDMQENGYQPDEEEDSERKLTTVSGNKYCDNENLDLFLRSSSEPVLEPMCSYYSLLMEKSEESLPPPGSGRVKLRKRSLSIPAFRKGGSSVFDPILSGAPRT
ncbi:hypothetical protein K1719_040939 [Acacia pycnantha]|nr:hypothetical protein K1719_040939 [Acacia pycnantha]